MSAERAVSARAALDGEYEILRELGIGGTAIVYLARNRSTGAEVAIKLIRATFLEDEEALARFAREARYASRLDHPNVVPIREVLPLGNGGVALVMAHVPGRTLKQFVRDEGRLPAARAEQILRDVAAGLNAAHAMDIIHRDVKPENIFIDEGGDALLADFGLARSTGSTDTQLTMTGVAVGTPTYMPPEQIDGAVVDARGDVYSLGLVCWEMLTGKRPWDGDSLYALLYHQKHDYLPDVREFRDDVPDRFAEVIMTAIEKDPESRWQSISEMIAALDGVIPSRRPIERPVSNDTVRIARPPAVRATPEAGALAVGEGAARAPGVSAGSAHLAVLSSLATELEPVELVEPPRRRARRLIAPIAAVLVALLALLGWRTFESRRSDAELGLRPLPDVATTTAAGAPGALVPSGLAAQDSSTARGVPTAAAPVGVAGAGGANGGTAAGTVMGADVRQPEPLSPVTPVTPAASAGATGTVAQRPDAAAAAASRRLVAPPPVVITIPAAPTAVAPPAAAPAAARATIVAGGLHSCFITGDGRGYCWGANARGQLGTSSNVRASAPTPVGGNLDLVTVATGLSHSCAIAQGGAVWCWGENDHGQLGDRSTASRASPVRVASSRVFHSIVAGAAHSCALDTDGGAWCWGAGAHGQLGNGSTNDASTPVAVPNWRFTALAAGWNFTCGLDASGRAYCWGENEGGQLGSGDTNDKSQPTPVSGDVAFTWIAAGSAHACGVSTRGEAYCWGRNASGQLGDGTTAGRAVPAPVKTDLRFTSIAAGAMHSCGVDAGGAAHCWGLDSYGQLGDGGSARQLQPVSVAGGHRFVSLRAFGSHTCGSTAAGEVFCWGYNLEGQLGDGTRTNRSRPVYLEPPAGR